MYLEFHEFFLVKKMRAAFTISCFEIKRNREKKMKQLTLLFSCRAGAVAMTVAV